MAITFTQDHNVQYTLSVCDEQERYYVEGEGELPLQAVADAFLSGYGVQDDSDGKPIKFWVEDASGNTVAAFVGQPDGPARQTR